MNKGANYFQDEYLSEESSVIIEKVRDLRLSTAGNKNRRVSMKVLDEELRRLHEEKGISMNKMRKVIRDFGICLKNCFQYGSPSKLRKALKNDRSLLVNRNEAKKYKYVKNCLIMVYN